MQRPRIAILGSAPSSVKLAPFADKNWQIWVCSPANLPQKLPRIDVWFEMHSWSLEDKKIKNPPYYNWLKRQPKVVMQQVDPEFPGSVAYPLNEVRKRWPWGSKYFMTSSPAEMMAMALLYEPEVIGLWGIDMAGASEWQVQRPGLHYWMEQADKQGCAVIAPGEADILCPPPIYGFCESTHMWRKLRARKAELEGRMAQAEQQIQNLQQTKLILQGAHESTVYEMRTWLPDVVDPRQVRPEAEPQSQSSGMPAKSNGTEEFLKNLADMKGRLKQAPKALPVPKKARAPRKNGKAKENQAQKQEAHRGASEPLPTLDGALSPGGSSGS